MPAEVEGLDYADARAVEVLRAARGRQVVVVAAVLRDLKQLICERIKQCFCYVKHLYRPLRGRERRSHSGRA